MTTKKTAVANRREHSLKQRRPTVTLHRLKNDNTEIVVTNVVDTNTNVVSVR